MRVGDRIAIKSTSTQRHDLPFDGRNNTVSCMTIRRLGRLLPTEETDAPSRSSGILRSIRRPGTFIRIAGQFGVYAAMSLSLSG